MLAQSKRTLGIQGRQWSSIYHQNSARTSEPAHSTQYQLRDDKSENSTEGLESSSAEFPYPMAPRDAAESFNQQLGLWRNQCACHHGSLPTHEALQSQPISHGTNGINNTNRTNGLQSNRALAASVSPSYVYIFSSKDSTGTLAMNEKPATYIQNLISDGHGPLQADLAYTPAKRRSRFQWATVVRARSLAELAVRLEEPHRKATRAMASPPRIGFVSNGQGAQRYAMGRDIIGTYPVFTSAIRHGDRILRQDYGASWSLYGM
jgi:acyl transferase domain-containing protein